MKPQDKPKVEKKTEEKPKSVLFDAIHEPLTTKKEKQEEKKEEPKESDDVFDNHFDLLLEQADKTEQTEDNEEKEGEKQEEQKESDDDDIDESKITGKAAEQWSKLKGSRDKWKNKYAELEKKLAESPSVSPDELNAMRSQLDEIKKERDSLKSSIDRIDYEQSLDFQEKYVAPIKAVAERIGEILPDSSELDSSESKRLAALSDKLSSLAGIKANKREFFSTVDEIIEEFIPARSLQSAFASEASELWKRATEFYAERENSKALSKKEMEERRKYLAGTRDNIFQELDSGLSEFESKAKQRIEAWNKSADFQYGEFKNKDFSQAKQLLAEFAETRKMTPELKELILHGALAPMDRKEKKFVSGVIVAQKNEIESLKQENERLKKAMEKRGGRINGSHSQDDDDDKPVRPEEWKTRSVLSEALKRR